MNFKEYKYVDTAFGKVSNRNHLNEVGRFELPENSIDCYQTYFRYDEEMIEHFRQTNSVGKYHGKCISDYIPIDIDNKNLDESLRIGRDFIRYLNYDFDVEYDSLGIYFSGSKGLHIEIPTNLIGNIEPSDNLPQRYKNFVQSFDNWGFDNKIYEKVRLWRIDNSINSTSGLYKVRLYPHELLSLNIDEIKELAREPRDSSNFIPYEDWDYSHCLLDVWEETESVIVPKKSISFSHSKDNLDFLEKGEEEGNRNNKTFENARKLKNLGYTSTEIDQLLCQWNNQNIPPLLEKEIKRTINNVCSFNITDSDSIGIRRLFRDYEPYMNFNSTQRDIFIQIVSRVNTQPKSWKWNGKMHHCDAGEMICSNQSIAKFCGKDVSRDQVRYVLDKFECEGMILMKRLDGKNGKLIKVLFLNYTEKYTPDKDI